MVPDFTTFLDFAVSFVQKVPHLTAPLTPQICATIRSVYGSNWLHVQHKCNGMSPGTLNIGTSTRCSCKSRRCLQSGKRDTILVLNISAQLGAWSMTTFCGKPFLFQLFLGETDQQVYRRPAFPTWTWEHFLLRWIWLELGGQKGETYPDLDLYTLTFQILFQEKAFALKCPNI